MVSFEWNVNMYFSLSEILAVLFIINSFPKIEIDFDFHQHFVSSLAGLYGVVFCDSVFDSEFLIYSTIAYLKISKFRNMLEN